MKTGRWCFQSRGFGVVLDFKNTPTSPPTGNHSSPHLTTGEVYLTCYRNRYTFFNALILLLLFIESIYFHFVLKYKMHDDIDQDVTMN